MKIHFEKKFIIAILLLGSFRISAQTKSISFAAIDKKVKTISSSSPDTLSYKLTSPYKTETEKVRALFRWITENITYDTRGYHNSTEVYAGLWQLSIASGAVDIKKDYNDRIVLKILKEKKAICDGYSRLFKTLCDYANIKCEIITGYIRWSSDPIGSMTNREHAWNAVFINNAWKLIDATWASGYTNSEVTEFKKSYSEFYFFTNPIEFFNDHYPTDNKWSLLPVTPTLTQFYNFPFYYPTFYQFRVVSLSPTTGYIDVSPKNKIVRIELEINDKVEDVYAYEYSSSGTVESTNTQDSMLVTDLVETGKSEFKIENKRLIYFYEIKSEKSDKLNVMLNDKLILTYGIRFRK